MKEKKPQFRVVVDSRGNEIIVSDEPADAGQRASSFPRKWDLNSTALGRNIRKLMNDCGWSYEALASESGISKAIIIGHVKHGKKATARLVKEYAETFSRGLGRTISPNDLIK